MMATGETALACNQTTERRAIVNSFGGLAYLRRRVPKYRAERPCRVHYCERIIARDAALIAHVQT